MKRLLMIIVATAVMSVAIAQNSAFIRTEGGEAKTPVQTVAVFESNCEVWFQSINTDSFTLRGGPMQKFGSLKLSECLSWTPESGAWAANLNAGQTSICDESKMFWEAGAYAPLNSKSCWSLVLYEARWLARVDQRLATGPVVYGKWVEGASNDALAFGIGAEYRIEGGCFYGRFARNVVSSKNEFRLQYAFGF